MFKGYVMTIRKNFIFQEDTVKYLEELSKLKNKTQTDIVKEAIEELYKKANIKNKLAILDEIRDSFHGQLTNIDANELHKEKRVEKY